MPREGGANNWLAKIRPKLRFGAPRKLSPKCNHEISQHIYPLFEDRLAVVENSAVCLASLWQHLLIILGGGQSGHGETQLSVCTYIVFFAPRPCIPPPTCSRPIFILHRSGCTEARRRERLHRSSASRRPAPAMRRIRSATWAIPNFPWSGSGVQKKRCVLLGGREGGMEGNRLALCPAGYGLRCAQCVLGV